MGGREAIEYREMGYNGVFRWGWDGGRDLGNNLDKRCVFTRRPNLDFMRDETWQRRVWIIEYVVAAVVP